MTRLGIKLGPHKSLVGCAINKGCMVKNVGYYIDLQYKKSLIPSLE